MKTVWIVLAMLFSGIFGAAANGGSIARKCSVQNEFRYAGTVYICAPLIVPTESEKPEEPISRRPVSI